MCVRVNLKRRKGNGETRKYGNGRGWFSDGLEMTIQYGHVDWKDLQKEPHSQTQPSSSSILASACALACEGSGQKNHADKHNLNLEEANKYSSNVPLRSPDSSALAHNLLLSASE